MGIHPLLAKVRDKHLRKEALEFDIGDTVDVNLKVKDGDKEKTVAFSGIVISRRGAGADENFTIRRIVDGEGVERIFPIHSPLIASVTVTKKALVRRAKLYYLRDRVGKSAYTLKERPAVKEGIGRKRSRVKARKAAAATPVAEAPAAVAAKVRKPKVRKSKEELAAAAKEKAAQGKKKK